MSAIKDLHIDVLNDEDEAEQPVCNHHWDFINESFGHDWAGGGIQHSGFWECRECGEETNKCPESLKD